MKGYKELEIYQLEFQLAVEIYKLSITLPNPDKFETGGQIRRSSQTTKDTIVEGYGRRRYKADFIKYLFTIILPVWNRYHKLNSLLPFILRPDGNQLLKDSKD